MRTLRAILAVLLLLLPLTGCWSDKEVQDLNYTIAMGVDYVKDEYVVYVQFLDFITVAKVEGGQSQSSKVWVGHASDPDLTMAIAKLYQSSQQRVYWDHMGALVFTGRLMEHGYKEVIDVVNRYRESRYNIWVYGTNEEMEGILSATAFFGLSSVNSILIEPTEAYKQYSSIRPIQWYEVIRDSQEASTTTIIPSLALKERTWEENKKPQKMLYMDGAHVYSNDTYRGKLTSAQLQGIQWQEKKMERFPLVIRKGGRTQGVFMLQKPVKKVIPYWEGQTIKFRMEVKLGAVIQEVGNEAVSIEELEQLASEEVRRQLRQAYVRGVGRGMDLFRLREILYRNYNGWWKEQVQQHGVQFLNEASLDSIHVTVDIIHKGRYMADES
ncbi:Ger(x)C family spore germination protein [Paenibacillus sp. YYML68]|uniref:Ger(x)C family spore germination protein n=1 Tax=Paenibacillus sp. YYML68 TaxID=2909250 RepID=UPI0024937C91|nr:Ger(x)C family spore germination protein [Paenibacillus sp. YYML68]